MLKKVSPAFAVQLGFVIAACSSSSTPPTITQACTDYADAICNRYSQCSNGYFISEQYGDLTTCVARYQSTCEARLNLASGQSATQTEACAQDLPSESCENLYGNNLAEVCRAPDGGGANGAVCTINAQCQTAYCAIPKDGLCGTCAAPPAAGDDCSVLVCGPGLTCLRETMTCGFQSASGSCLVEGDCQFGFACLDPYGDGGVCVVAGDAGTPCDVEKLSGPACPGRLGLYCQRVPPDGGVCALLGLGDAGDACGNVQGVGTVCVQSGICQKPSPDAGEGTCLGYASDGTACDSDGGPDCLPLAKCVPSSDAGTAGTCQEPAKVACQ
jgi:hypothetical protein